MVRRRQRERSLFEVLLPDGHKLWPDWLRRIDTVLEDEAVIEVVAQALRYRILVLQPTRAAPNDLIRAARPIRHDALKTAPCAAWDKSPPRAQ